MHHACMDEWCTYMVASFRQLFFLLLEVDSITTNIRGFKSPPIRHRFVMWPMTWCQLTTRAPPDQLDLCPPIGKTSLSSLGRLLSSQQKSRYFRTPLVHCPLRSLPGTPIYRRFGRLNGRLCPHTKRRRPCCDHQCQTSTCRLPRCLPRPLRLRELSLSLSSLYHTSISIWNFEFVALSFSSNALTF